MNFDQLWGVGFGTVLSVGVLFGLIRFQRVMRNRLFPSTGKRERGQAMTELLLLQARLEKKAGQANSLEEGGEGRPGPEGGSDSGP